MTAIILIGLQTLHVAKKELFSWVYPCKMNKGMYCLGQVVICRAKIVISHELTNWVIITPTGEQQCCKESKMGQGAAAWGREGLNFSVEGIFEVKIESWKKLVQVTKFMPLWRNILGTLMPTSWISWSNSSFMLGHWAKSLNSAIKTSWTAENDIWSSMGWVITYSLLLYRAFKRKN